MKSATIETQAGFLKRNVPNTITVISLCSGLTAIRMVLADRIELAVLFILLSVVLDGVDGKMARYLNVSSPFGAELDSLADFLCFGVAPGLVLYRYLFEGTPYAGIGWMVVLCLVISCILRLARFNIAADRKPKDGIKSPYFVGVPAPALAFLALAPVFLILSGVDSVQSHPFMLLPYLAGVAGLAISTIPTFSPVSAWRRLGPKKWLPFLVIICIAGAFTFFWQFLVLVSVLYLCSIGFSHFAAKNQ